MIITMFKGGVGNQLFQYAAAKKFSIKGNTELKFDLSNYAGRNTYILWYFNIPQNIARPEEYEGFKNKGLRFLFEKTIPYYLRRVVSEKNGMFDKNLIELKRKNMYTRGYFQSWKYFTGIEETLRNEFTLKTDISEKYRDILDRINSTNSISVHIRRGDILLGIVKNEKPALTTDYYKNAVEYIIKNVKDPLFFIFSDDVEWAKENLKFIPNMVFISGKGIKDYEELSIMSHCKHNIIANSTFGWWGAWLNSNKNKIIINPKHWFLDKKKDRIYTKNLIPESWIAM